MTHRSCCNQRPKIKLVSFESGATSTTQPRLLTTLPSLTLVSAASERRHHPAVSRQQNYFLEIQIDQSAGSMAYILPQPDSAATFPGWPRSCHLHVKDGLSRWPLPVQRVAGQPGIPPEQHTTHTTPIRRISGSNGSGEKKWIVCCMFRWKVNFATTSNNNKTKAAGAQAARQPSSLPSAAPGCGFKRGNQGSASSEYQRLQFFFRAFLHLPRSVCVCRSYLQCPTGARARASSGTLAAAKHGELPAHIG